MEFELSYWFQNMANEMRGAIRSTGVNLKDAMVLSANGFELTEKKPQPGDKVRATSVVVGTMLDDLGSIDPESEELTIEVIEPADDPSQDPVGTVRRNPEKYEVRNAVKMHTGHAPWYYIPDNPEEGQPLTDDFVSGWEIIGAVPGTPAVDALVS